MKERTSLLLLQKKKKYWEHSEQFYINKLDNLNEMDKFLERHKLTKPTQEEIVYLSRPVTSKLI